MSKGEKRHLTIVKEDSVGFPVVVDRVAQAVANGGHLDIPLVELSPDPAPRAPSRTEATTPPPAPESGRKIRVREALIGGLATIVAAGALATTRDSEKDTGTPVRADHNPAAQVTKDGSTVFNNGTDYISGNYYRHIVREGDTIEGIAQELSANAPANSAISAEALQPYLHDSPTPNDGQVQVPGDGILQVGERVIADTSESNR